MRTEKYKISDLLKFENGVFGADCFLANWPEIKTTGIPLLKIGDCYYVVDSNNEPVDDTAFFTEEELTHCMVKC